MMMAAVAMMILGSCQKNAGPSASLKSDLDTLSYELGMANSQGLKMYLANALGVDTAYMSEFYKGLVQSANAGDDKKKAAYFAGIQIGQQLGTQMYSNINNGWPIDSWELTEPSLGYQTYYIRLISNFVQEKGVDIGEKIPSAIKKPVTTAKITPTIEASVSHNAILVTTSRESTVHVCIFDMHGNKVVSLQEKYRWKLLITKDWSKHWAA